VSEFSTLAVGKGGSYARELKGERFQTNKNHPNPLTFLIAKFSFIIKN
jgi:hypothetical protein